MSTYVVTAIFIFTALASVSAASEAQSGGMIEEVLVTATKRTESLQDVPISIGVVSGDAVEAYDIADLTDLQGFVPGLSVQSTFGNWTVRIRGLGSGQTNLAFDSSVSIFKDGVYCGRSRCLEAGFLDADRVEVARGPQGALFGKSTIAGAISVISAKPTDSLEGLIRLGLETNYGGYTADTVISGPLSEHINGHFAMRIYDKDGFISNPFVPDDDGAEDGYAMRGTLDWDLGEQTTALLKFERTRDDLIGRSNQLVSPGAFGATTADTDAEYVLDYTRRVSTGVGTQDFDKAEGDNITLTLGTEVADHDLTFIANHMNLEYHNLLDVDGVQEFLLNTSLGEDYDQTSFEARLLSPVNQNITYIVGALYHQSDTVTRQYSSFIGWGPFASLSTPVGSDRNFERDTDTLSIYGQLTLDLTERLRLTADLRYTEEEQDGHAHGFPVTYPNLVDPVYTPDAAFQQVEYRFWQQREDEHLDPSIKLQYAWNDDLMTYITYATGSKPGGLKANDATLGAQLLALTAEEQERRIGRTVTADDVIAGLYLPQSNGIFDFEDEEAENIEVGLKSTFLDGRATVNLAVYSMEFDNLQTSSYDGTRFIIANAASADIKGLELESIFFPMENLRLAGSVAVIDAKYAEFMAAQCLVANEQGGFENPDCVDGQEDLRGEKLERTPDWEAQFSADWVTTLSTDLELTVGLSMFHTDGYHTRQDFHPLGDQESYQRWDVRLALAGQSQAWEVALVGRNLTDEKVIQHAYEIAGSNFVSIGRGRMVTIEGLYRF